MLGGALLGPKKYAEAEPLLLAGYEGMKQREKRIPPQGRDRIPKALDQLIELYAATNKPDEAKKWQAERAKYPAVPKQPEKKWLAEGPATFGRMAGRVPNIIGKMRMAWVKSESKCFSPIR